MAKSKKVHDMHKSIVERDGKYCVTHCHGPDAGKPIKCFPTREEAEKMHRAIQANKSKVVGAIAKYIQDKDIDYRLDAYRMFFKCKQCENYVHSLMYYDNFETFTTYKTAVESLQPILEEIQKSKVCQCIECGYAMMVGNDQTCMHTPCPICGADMHTMIAPPYRSSRSTDLNPMEVKKMEDEKEKENGKEDEKKDVEKTTKAEDAPSAPVKEEEEKEEEKYEEMDTKSMSKAIRDLQKSVETIGKAVESNSLLIKDAVKLHKDNDQDEDTLKIEEKDESPSGEVAAGTELSLKGKDMDLHTALDVIKKSGLTVTNAVTGTPAGIDKAKDDVRGPAGIVPLVKSRDGQLLDKLKEDLKKCAGPEKTAQKPMDLTLGKPPAPTA